MEATDRLVSREEAAGILGVRKQTLASWKSTARYQLPVVKVGRLAKYKMSDIEAFIRSRTEDPGAQGAE